MFLPCARNAILNRKDMMPIDPHTSNAEMPVIFKSHVNTTPSPHMVVRKVTNDMANATLTMSVNRVSWKILEHKADLQQSGDGNTSAIDPAKDTGSLA
jgi:hypothetical protein